MGFATMTLLFAMLTIVANVAVVGFVVLAVAGTISPRGAAVRDAVWSRVADVALPLAAIVALTATLGSLYYSEIVHLVPCALCWYQRIAMYPLPVILAIAAWRGDRRIRTYAIPIAAIGGAIALYHYQLEWFPDQGNLACAVGVPCNVPYFREFGFISLAYMALSGFLLIAALTWVAGQRGEEQVK
jgi:disulfide bond formation protein DsbB